MVGRDVIFRMEQMTVEKGKPILHAENLTAFNDKGVLALKDVSFSVPEGEIFGIAGVSGNGQQVLAEVLAGLRKPQGGKVFLDGADITHSSTLDRWLKGIPQATPPGRRAPVANQVEEEDVVARETGDEVAAVQQQREQGQQERDR